MIMIVNSDNLPLNFFGGFDKSPASGHTTHLSSTNLENDWNYLKDNLISLTDIN